MTPRPASLKEVAEKSDSLTEFGSHFRDWLHEVRRTSSQPQLMRAIADEPPRLNGRFPQGDVADAWLAAYAEHVASRVDRVPPEWAFRKFRTLEDPWFADVSDSAALRLLALARSPLAFKRRNLYTFSVDLPLRLHAGRPAIPSAEKRKKNAARQRAFRVRRGAELAALRRLAAKYLRSRE